MAEKAPALATPPRISVCLPVRNTQPFLAERIASIEAQTLGDWEVIAVDGCSTDGSWETLQGWAARDPRVHAVEARPEGIYPGINRCIREARGALVYIATSDDTMAPDCLERMAAALDANPSCDLALCRLKIIDQNGVDLGDWWDRYSPFALSTPDLVGQSHVRHAPYDGLLHFGRVSIYVSMTQLLIRRTVFDSVGLFDPRWGSIGDFNWDMRAALTHDTVYVPESWGGWRIHASQATAAVDENTPEHQRLKQDMIAHATASARGRVPAPLRRLLDPPFPDYPLRHDAFGEAWRARPVPWRRYAFLLGQCLAGHRGAREYLAERIRLRGALPGHYSATIRRWLEDRGRVVFSAARR